MTEQELIERIDRLSGQQIVNMSDESLKRLTLDFKESFVRRVVAVGESLRDQEIILGRFDEALRNYNDSFIDGWPGWLNNGFESVSNIRFDLECGILIKNQPESVDFNKTMDDYKNNKLTSEEINELLLNADTINFTSDNTNPATALEQRIKELEEENEQLKEKVKELEESKQLLDTSLDGVEADSKVGLTEILKLMENDGANFDKHNNKTIAAKALKMMTGRSESACKQIFSSPLSPTYSGHKKKISELNGYLEALGMKTLL